MMDPDHETDSPRPWRPAVPRPTPRARARDIVASLDSAPTIVCANPWLDER
jgi:hypothetical protein